MDRHVVYIQRREAARRLRTKGVLAMAAVAIASLAASKPSHAQFAATPAPIAVAGEKWSDADTPRGYRRDGAQHLYASYPQHVHHGKLPPLMYAIAITETEIDENGKVVRAAVVREPAAAKEVSPWVVSMIRHASPFPKPARLGHVTYTDIWLVDRTGKFQLDTLTEGQQ